MAPRRPPQRRGSQSPNTVLVVFLIFFILGTIIAGVLAYYGYDGQKKLKDDVKSAEAKAKAAEKDREWAVFQSYIARKAMGTALLKNDTADEDTPYQADLDGVKIDPKEVSFAESKFKDEKTRAAVEEMFKKAVEDLGWDAAGKKFKTNYRDQIARVSAQVTKAQGEYAMALKQKDDLKDEVEKIAARRKEFYEKAAADIKDANEKALAAALEKTKQIGELLKANTDLNDKIKLTKEKAEQDLRTKDKRIFELSTLLTNVKREIQVANAAEGGAAPADGAAAPPRAAGKVHALLLDVSQGRALWDRPVAKITRVDATGRKVYLNKGRAQGIRPQLSFTVFGAASNGSAEGPIKGTVEVQEVLDDNSSIAWITSLYDAHGNEVPLFDRRENSTLRQTENPIQAGDLLFNLTFGSHVAVAGVPSWAVASNPSPAEQMRQLRLFLAVLQKQGVTVDAYLDLTDGQIKGAITSRTNYLIKGDLPGTGGEAADAGVKMARGVQDSAKKMRDAAVAKGAFVISADNFLVVIGYRRPQGAEDSQVSGWRPSTITAGTGNIGQALEGKENPKQEQK